MFDADMGADNAALVLILFGMLALFWVAIWLFADRCEVARQRVKLNDFLAIHARNKYRIGDLAKHRRNIAAKKGGRNV